MGQAVVSDSCRPEDPSCSRSGFDAPVALGASVTPDVHMQLRGSASPGFHLESAAPSILAVEGGHVTAEGEGASAILFVSDGGNVLDFLHVWVKRPTELALLSQNTGGGMHEVRGTVELLPRESLRVRATLRADGVTLMGNADTEWIVDPPIARFLKEGDTGERRIIAERPGKAMVHAKSLGLEATLELVVAKDGAS
jgi:hypothetical protein